MNVSFRKLVVLRQNLTLINLQMQNLQNIHSNLLVLKFGTMAHLVQLLKFEKSDFQIAGKCTSDYKINVKIALLFPKNYGVMTQVHEC